MSEKVGKLGGVPIRLSLSASVDDRYQKRYIPVYPDQARRGSQEAFEVDDAVTLWKIDKWSGGEGDDLYDPSDERYWRSFNARPANLGEGMILGARHFEAVDQVSQSLLLDFKYITVAEGAVFCVRDNELWKTYDGGHELELHVAGLPANPCSITDGLDGYVYIGFEDGSIRRVTVDGAPPTIQTWAGSAFTTPILHGYDGRVYVVSVDDLFEITDWGAGTSVLRSDLNGRSLAWRSREYSRQRITVGPRGPLWLQALNNGQTTIWEYVVDDDTTEKSFVLPTSYVQPTSILYGYGFTFVGFRQATVEQNVGAAYIYYHRPGLEGVFGPFRSPNGDWSNPAVGSAGKEPMIAGTLGEQVIVAWDGTVWSYTLSTGAIAVFGESAPTDPRDACVLGNWVYVVDESDGKVHVWNGAEYALSGWVETGRWDQDYPGLKKLLSEVVITTDPLPANCSISCDVSADLDSFVTVGSSMTTEGATTHSFTVPSGTVISGRELSAKLTLTTADPTISPTLRTVSVRSTSGARRLEWVLRVDAVDAKGGDLYQNAEKLLDDLIGLTTAGPVTFEDPFQQAYGQSPDVHTVTIEECFLPMRQEDGAPSVQIRLRRLGLVEV